MLDISTKRNRGSFQVAAAEPELTGLQRNLETLQTPQTPAKDEDRKRRRAILSGAEAVIAQTNPDLYKSVKDETVPRIQFGDMGEMAKLLKIDKPEGPFGVVNIVSDDKPKKVKGYLVLIDQKMLKQLDTAVATLVCSLTEVQRRQAGKKLNDPAKDSEALQAAVSENLKTMISKMEKDLRAGVVPKEGREVAQDLIRSLQQYAENPKKLLEVK